MQVFLKKIGNVQIRDVVPKFPDLEVIALSLTAGSLSINREDYLFDKLDHY